MRVTDVVVEVRDRTLRRRGQIEPAYLDLRANLRDMTVPDPEPSDWTLRLPAEHYLVPVLREAGSGIVVTHVDPTVGPLWSGPTEPTTDDVTTDDPRGTVTFTGTTDDALLFWRHARPTPAVDMSGQGGHDVREGPGEQVAAEYVAANLGPLATPDRVVPGLVVTDLGRGPTVRRAARYDRLADLVGGIAAESGLLPRLVQVDDHLEFTHVPVRDRTGRVRLGVVQGGLVSHTTTTRPPTLTAVVVLGQGDLASRTSIERTLEGTPGSWGAWGRREGVLDQRQTDDPAALAAAGDQALLEALEGTVEVAAIPTDDATHPFPDWWGLGDRITVVLGQAELPARVTSVAIILGPDGVKVGAGIGPLAGWTPTAKLEREQAALRRRIAALEALVPAATVEPTP